MGMMGLGNGPTIHRKCGGKCISKDTGKTFEWGKLRGKVSGTWCKKCKKFVKDWYIDWKSGPLSARCSSKTLYLNLKSWLTETDLKKKKMVVVKRPDLAQLRLTLEFLRDTHCLTGRGLKLEKYAWDLYEKRHFSKKGRK